MTIGQVVEQLKNDYPDISISKIRYLESEGLLKPARSRGGYRQFSESEVQKLKTILTLQTEHYLPLQVIKSRLKNGSFSAIETTVKTSEPISDHNESEYNFVALSKKTGISIGKLEELQKYGLIQERQVSGEEIFTGTDLSIASLAKKLEKFGIGPRHLRMYVSAAERQAAVYKQIFGPKLNRSTSSAKIRESVNEVKQTIEELEGFLLNREIDQIFH